MSGFDYGGKRPDGQHERHPMLPGEERKTFVRPLRDSYRHVGCRPEGPTRPLTAEEAQLHAAAKYELFEPYGPDRAPKVGRFWTRRQLQSGCGQVTTMGRGLAETYAASPGYYGSTFCSTCRGYFLVGAGGEFVWVEADGKDGPRVGT